MKKKDFERIKAQLVFLIIPVTVLSTQSGPTVKTEVSATGNGQVRVETNVEQQSSSKSEVSVSSENTQTNSDNKDNIYKKIEIEVNGKKQVVESTEAGTTSLTVLGTATAGALVSTAQQKPILFKQESITTQEYIWEQIRKTIREFFDGLFGQ